MMICSINHSLRVPLPPCALIGIVGWLLGGGFGAQAQLPAFPGAEGEGMYVSGGRGGDVYRVTNLQDSGTGSLRYGVINAPVGGRTIVFDVGGMISLASTLNFNKANVTVAGQTAPGIGICLRNYGAAVSAQNIIVRHLRFRPGDASKGPSPGFNGDSLAINASRVMIDHCSASWGIDEVLSSAGAGSYDVTVQNCFITEGLDQTGLYHGAWDPNYDPGGSGRHSMGSLIKPLSGNGQVTFHHNFWAMNGNRNPGVGTYNATQVFKTDIRNNVIYNNRNNGYRSAGPSSRFDLNYVGNYIIAGPETTTTWRSRAFDAKNEDGNFFIHQTGNKIDGNSNLIRDGTDTGWGMFAGTFSTLATPAPMRPVTTQTAEAAYHRVISLAGALPWARDSVDARHIEGLFQLMGTIIDSQSEVGGYPQIPTVTRPPGWDTDNDGLPDYWETALGMNPYVVNNNRVNTDGYTDLEHYLNWLAAPHAIGQANGVVDVDLRSFSRGLASNALFTVVAPTNGSVTLLGDGYTARFTPTTNFFGRGAFGFTANDSLANGGLANVVGLLIVPPPPKPRFTTASDVAGQLVLGGDRGTPGMKYHLLRATNVALPLPQWTRVATNHFDGDGRFVVTNTPPSHPFQMFYQLEQP